MCEQRKMKQRLMVKKQIHVTCYVALVLHVEPRDELNMNNKLYSWIKNSLNI